MRTEDINTCTGWNKCISSPSVLLLYLNTCGYSENICLDVTQKLEQFPSRQLQNQPDFGLICAVTFPTFAQVGAAITAVDMAKHIWHIRLPLAVGSPVKDFQILSAFSHLCQVGGVVSGW